MLHLGLLTFVVIYITISGPCQPQWTIAQPCALTLFSVRDKGTIAATVRPRNPVEVSTAITKSSNAANHLLKPMNPAEYQRNTT